MFSRTSAAIVAAWLATALPASAFEASGRVKILTYNIAGLPDGVMTAHPRRNMPRIGELLSGYDLVFVQEDFAYGRELRQRMSLPYASEPFVRGSRLDFGDGLSQFSKFPFSTYRRSPWQTCHGIIDSYFDCLTPKGFTFARQQILSGVEVDVYNLHMDAGGSAEDALARQAQLQQLAGAVEQFSRGRAVIVAGDTNVPARQREVLKQFLARTGLLDACETVRCAEPRRIDRVLYRSSPGVRLDARRWRIDRRFVDENQRPLSDHLAVSVEIEWTKRGFAP